jgi:hypothetical protein
MSVQPMRLRSRKDAAMTKPVRPLRAPVDFKQSNIVRALKSARDGGLDPAGIEIDTKTGVIRIFTAAADGSGEAKTTNPWDEVLNAPDKKRAP